MESLNIYKVKFQDIKYETDYYLSYFNDDIPNTSISYRTTIFNIRNNPYILGFKIKKP